MARAVESMLVDGSLLWLTFLAMWALVAMAKQWKNFIPLLLLPPVAALFCVLIYDFWSNLL